VRRKLGIEYTDQLLNGTKALDRSISMADSIGLDYPEVEEMNANLERLQFEISSLSDSRG
jgi:hypothetical protein